MAEARSAAQDGQGSRLLCLAIRTRGAYRSTSGGPKGSRLPESWQGRDRSDSGPTAKFRLVKILKQAPARWMRPGSENRGSTSYCAKD